MLGKAVVHTLLTARYELALLSAVSGMCSSNLNEGFCMSVLRYTVDMCSGPGFFCFSQVDNNFLIVTN